MSDEPTVERGEQKIWAALGRVPDKPVDDRSLLADLFGRNTRGGVDTKTAARELEVSERTVRRWAKDGIPSHEKGNLARERHEQWRNSPQGRKQQLNPRREARLRKHGGQLKFYGGVKISSDKRRRKVNLDLSQAQMNALMDATLSGDDAAALAVLEQIAGEMFGGSVDLEIESLETRG